MSKTSKWAVTKVVGNIRDGMTIEELQELIDKANSVPYIKATVSVIRSYGDDYYSDGDEIEITVSRIETDEEYTQRLNREKHILEAKNKRKEAQALKRKASADKKREDDRKLYEELKKQFESEN